MPDLNASLLSGEVCIKVLVFLSPYKHPVALLVYGDLVEQGEGN